MARSFLYLSYTANIHLAITRDDCAARIFRCRLQVANAKPISLSVIVPNYSLDLFTFTLIVSIIFRVDARAKPMSSILIIFDKFDFMTGGRVAFHISVISTPAFANPATIVAISQYLINTKTRYCSHPRY